jgi:type I restriction enzyme, S subunit
VAAPLSEAKEVCARAPLSSMLAQPPQYGLSVRARPNGKGLAMLKMNCIDDGKLRMDDLDRIEDPSVDAREYVLQPGDILFNRTNSAELVGKSAVFCGAALPITFASYLVRLRCDARHDPDYVCLALNSHIGREFVRQAMGRAIGQANVSASKLSAFCIPDPPLSEQRRIVAALNERRSAVRAANHKTERSLEDLDRLLDVELTDGLASASQKCALGDCLAELKGGVGDGWARFPVLGTTRNGIAPAKEPVGRNPERYKFVPTGTIFYNPMRILIGSIALVDGHASEGIVSPDYVAVRPNTDILLPRFFYYWLRSQYGASVILDTARGAVRERMMFKGLSKIEMPLPDLKRQFRFERLFQSAQALRSQLIEQQLQLATLDAALLRAAFSGAL